MEDRANNLLQVVLVAVILLVVQSVGESGDRLAGFVAIQGGTFHRGRGASPSGAEVRVEDFDILDHPVSNQEYLQFVQATGHRCPLHWPDDQIPAGCDDFPVVFVNRGDALAYLAWLSRQEGRICRLPTAAEFEYASRGGQSSSSYPWGNEVARRKSQL